MDRWEWPSKHRGRYGRYLLSVCVRILTKAGVTLRYVTLRYAGLRYVTF